MKSFAAFYVICTLALVVRAETEVDESLSADPKPGDLVDGDLDGDKDLWDWKNEDLTNQIDADSENSVASQMDATRVKRNVGKLVVEGAKFIGRRFRIHNVLLKNRKTAQEAAREAGKGNTPIHHRASNGKNPHFHPVGKNGKKIPGAHYSYRNKG